MGSFSNGVPAFISIDGYQATVVLNGNFAFSGGINCQDYGNEAYVSYEISNPSIPGVVYGQGSIVLGGDGRAYFSVNQNNGLSFNAVR